jgi:alpha-beta hydrolase superfamily lysophospholipase
MWLRDSLPVHLKHTRSIIYGYDTKLTTSESFQTVDDIALSFTARLKSIRRSISSAKPLVFIAHSLGGIVLKRAVLEMANSGDTGGSMLAAIRGIILFGVPNKGMMMSHLLPMVRGHPNAALIRALSPKSIYLTDLDERFSGTVLRRRVRIISVFETKRTQIPKVISYSVI